MDDTEQEMIIEQLDVSEVIIDDDEEPREYTIEVERYNIWARIQHWINLAVMLTLAFTGLEIAIKQFWIGEFMGTQNTHLIAGYIIFANSVVLYLFILIKSGKFKHVFPMPRDVLDLMIIVACGIGLLPDRCYPHYDFYCPEKKKYISKYHPVQKFLATANLGALMLIGITGFALLKEINPARTGIFETVGFAIMEPFIRYGLNVRLTHYIFFVYFVMSTTIHFYFAVLLKENRGRMRGMVLGREKLHFHEEKYLEYLGSQECPTLGDKIAYRVKMMRRRFRFK